MTQKVFVSYCHQDEKVVNTFLSLLPKAFDVWMDYQNLKSGEYYVSKLFEEISTSDIYLIFLSKASQNSKWVKEELEYALQVAIDKGHLKIAGIVLDALPIPEALVHRHLIDGKKSIYYAAKAFVKDFHTEAISMEDMTHITSISIGLAACHIGVFSEDLSSEEINEESGPLLVELRKKIQGLILNFIDVKDFYLHSPVPQIRNGYFNERYQKTEGDKDGTIDEQAMVEATVFRPAETKIHNYLENRIDDFNCSYMSFGFSNPKMVGKNKTEFEINSLKKLQEKYTIVGYDAEVGVKIKFDKDLFVYVAYPEDGIKIRIEPEYNFEFKSQMKKVDVFQFVDWLLTE